MDLSVPLAFPLLLALFTPCSACFCKLQHPQTYYCRSDIVLLADILGPGENTKLKRGFKVKVHKIFKNVMTSLTEIKNVYSPLRSEDCGYENTTEQSQVVIAGFVRAKRVIFTKCHMLVSWNQLTENQRIGYEGEYEKGCKCQIERCLVCSIGCPKADLTDCVWAQTNCDYSSWKGNRSLHFMCLPSITNQCAWTGVQASAPVPVTSSILV